MHVDSRMGVSVLTVTATCASTLGALYLLFAWLHRDPDRIIPADESLVLSPADGLVSAILALTDGEFVTRVSIFLSPLDVHVNRAPVTGKIADVQYRPGRLGNVLRGKAGTTPLARQRKPRPDESGPV